jgi:SAM-dependent methyltransferase
MGILRSWGRWICARAAGEALAVGCDDGEVAKVLEREGHRVVVSDPGRAGDLPFEDESFDTVVLGELLAEWASRERPLAEARRVLRPGGRLIVAAPYAAGTAEDASGVSLRGLLDELGQFSVGEVATVEDRLCVLAELRRERSKAGVWRRALGVAEERLGESEEARAALVASVAALEASRGREERALAEARRDVERLETALAAATHQRDLEQEKARLAGDGVVHLEQRLAVARARLEELERGAAAAREAQRELSTAFEARAQLEARLKAAEGGIDSRDAELKRLRAAARELGRKLTLREAQLEKEQQRAAHFRGSLVALREGRAYRLMRMLWWLRRPFRRPPRDATARDLADDEQDPPSGLALPLRPAPPRPRRLARSLQPGERLRVASILDEMSEACFAPECELVPLPREGWHEQLDQREPDLLLVESAWNGNGGEWQHRIATYPRKDLVGLPALRALVEGCRERGIPTAFWNKEDPVHFGRFCEAASFFEYVFTTDAGCVDLYHGLPGEHDVAAMPFAAQPRIHNPVAAVRERSVSPCFAGAWYRDRHPDRRRALEALLDAARPYGLVVYDRRFGADDAAFGFPERFAPHVLGKLPYERIPDVYKSHRVFLNANSVTDSPTMCSRRVFELAACDTAILSTPATALARLFGEEVIVEATNEKDAAEALERLLEDPAERSRRTRAARRAVFAEHTYADRLAQIAGLIGLDGASRSRRPFAVPGDSPNGAAVNGVGDRHPWQLALQPGLGLSEPALADLAAATTFAEADVIGVHPGGEGGTVEHRYVDDLDPRALLLRRELVEARSRISGSAEEVGARLREWSDDGVRLYAADADLISLRDAVPAAIGSR